jgi:hypothetical protein
MSSEETLTTARRFRDALSSDHRARTMTPSLRKLRLAVLVAKAPTRYHLTCHSPTDTEGSVNYPLAPTPCLKDLNQLSKIHACTAVSSSNLPTHPRLFSANPSACSHLTPFAATAFVCRPTDKIHHRDPAFGSTKAAATLGFCASGKGNRSLPLYSLSRHGHIAVLSDRLHAPTARQTPA